MAFDLEQLDKLADDLAAPIDVEIMHPATGEATGWVVQVISPSSAAYQERITAIAARYGTKAKHLKPRSEAALALEKAQSIETVAAAIVGWTGLLEGKKPVEYSQAKAVEIITKLPAIAEQIAAAATNADAFFQRPDPA